MSSWRLRTFAIAVAFASWVIVVPASLATEQRETEQDKVGSIQEETAEAIVAIKQYSAAQRDQALARAKTLIEELDVRIAELKTWLDQHWEPMQAAAREQAHDTLSQLEAKRADLAKAYETLETSSSSAWEDVKQSFLEHYQTLRGAFDAARSEL
ncbi:MAG: hypothetical protein L0H73_12470 [Nitrococcus sp.]|nr:hypothetical protein [Nitrococcus sp.]